jgi:hypothetical protein
MYSNTNYRNRYNEISVVERSIRDMKNTYEPNMKSLKTLISISIIDKLSEIQFKNVKNNSVYIKMSDRMGVKGTSEQKNSIITRHYNW